MKIRKSPRLADETLGLCIEDLLDKKNMDKENKEENIKETRLLIIEATKMYDEYLPKVKKPSDQLSSGNYTAQYHRPSRP